MITKTRLPFALLSVFLFTGASSNYGYHLVNDHGPQDLLSRYAVHVPMNTPYDAQKLATWLERNGFDVAGSNWRKQYVEVITSDRGIQYLKAKGLQGRTIQKRTKQFDNTSIDPHYLNPDKVAAALQAMNRTFPALTRLEQIGTSLEGRPIFALLISNTPQKGDPKVWEKPTVIFDGMHHAREIMTPEIVVDVANQLLTGANQGGFFGKILDSVNVWVVPMLNVDGNNIVWTKDAWWRKNAHAESGTAYGVDLNRNYPFEWNKCNGSSGNKGNETYRGDKPASEPETQALVGLAEAVQPTVSLSYHSYSEFVLFPFGCDGELTGENALEEKIAHELADILPTDDGRSKYTPGAPWQILYSVDGDSMGFMFSEFGALAYTFEVNQEFQPSYALVAPTLAKHRKAWSYVLNRMQTNLLKLKVLDARTGQITAAVIDISTIKHVRGEKPFRTNPAGNFFKILDPGAYSILATLPDGRKASLDLQMNGPVEKVLTIN